MGASTWDWFQRSGQGQGGGLEERPLFVDLKFGCQSHEHRKREVMSMRLLLTLVGLDPGTKLPKAFSSSTV